MRAPSVFATISLTSNAPSLVRACNSSSEEIIKRNETINVLKFSLNALGRSTPNGIKATMFPRLNSQIERIVGNLNGHLLGMS